MAPRSTLKVEADKAAEWRARGGAQRSAQTGREQERGAQNEHGQRSERSAQSGSESEQGARSERGQKSERSAQSGRESERGARSEHEQRGERSAQSGREKEQGARSEHGQKSERSAQSGRETERESGVRNEHKSAQQERRGRGEQHGEGHRTAKAGQNTGTLEGGQREENLRREGGRDARDTEFRQRESNVGGAGRRGDVGTFENERGSRERVNFHISAPQRTEMRTFIANDRGMRVYHRSDIDFGVRVGERIPPRFEIYNAPPRFVEIEPEFRRFKIVALDDVILVVDPDTREIVEVIPI